MSESDDRLLRQAFGDFRYHAAGEVRPAPAAAIVYRARRRQRNRIAGWTALGLVLVLAPGALIGGVALRNGAAPGAPGTPPATAGPSVSGAVSPSPTPSVVPVTTTPATKGPGELANATLTLDWSWVWESSPEKPCRDGAVRFRNGTVGPHPGIGGQQILDVAYMDINDDGADDVVARIECVFGEPSAKQIIAYEKAADGGFDLLGVVVRTVHAGGADRIADITAFAVTGDSGIRVRVADAQPCCGMPRSAAVQQWRGYRWTGAEFRQDDGPTTFEADRSVADITVSVPTVQMTRISEARWEGTLTIKLTNRGPQLAEDVSLWIDLRHVDVGSNIDRPVCGDSVHLVGVVCTVGLLPPSSDFGITLALSYAAPDPPPTITGYIQVRAGEYRYGPAYGEGITLRFR